MLISPAFAAEVSAAAPDAPSTLVSMLPILLVILVFYFLVVRPQSARIQAHRKMVDALKKGDKVVTGGGLVAMVVKLGDDGEIVLKLADGVEVTALRDTILSVRGADKAGKKKD